MRGEEGMIGMKPKNKNQVIKTILWNPKSLTFWEVKVNVKDVEFIKSCTDYIKAMGEIE